MREELSYTIEEGLSFIMSHFQEPLWPRTVSTAATKNAQILVYCREEALARFQDTNLLDCKINSYPAYTQYNGINRQPPYFIFIDLDRSNFGSERALRLALKKSLENIRYLEAEPTVLWSGNGYHVYLPINAFVLEQEELFTKFDRPSQSFLRFAEWYLSRGKSDSAHNSTVSFRNCMLRVPGSYNSKCPQELSEVKIIRRWNGLRPNINRLLGSFYASLIDRRLKEAYDKIRRKSYVAIYNGSSTNIIPWIEKLLQTPIRDHRKYVIWRILAPYLINIRKLSNGEAFVIIKQWLDECSYIRKLDFDPISKIKAGLKGSLRGYFPINLDNLRTECNEVFKVVNSDGK